MNIIRREHNFVNIASYRQRNSRKHKIAMKILEHNRLKPKLYIATSTEICLKLQYMQR